MACFSFVNYLTSSHHLSTKFSAYSLPYLMVKRPKRTTKWLQVNDFTKVLFFNFKFQFNCCFFFEP